MKFLTTTISRERGDNDEEDCQPLLPITTSSSSGGLQQQKQRYDDGDDNTEPEQQKSPPPRAVYIIAGCAALNTCNVGFDIGVNSPAGILLQQDLQWDDWELEVFMGLLNFFALFGALMSSRIVRRYGMKVAFTISSLLFLVGLILMVGTQRSTTSTTIANATTHTDDGQQGHDDEEIMILASIFIGRALVGLGVGFGFAITPQYIAEISPKHHRGAFVSWSEIGCNVGILLGFGTGFWFRNCPIGTGWRWMFGTGCILPVVMIALIWCGVLEESPRWLVTKGRYEDSLKVLKRLNKKNGSTNPPAAETTVTTTTSKCDDEDDVDADVRRILKDIQNDMEQERQSIMAQQDNSIEPATGFGWLLYQKKPPAVRKMLEMAFGIAISHEICGIDAIQYYIVFILQASGVTSRDEQALYLVALGGLKLACLFVAMGLVDSLGRRPLLMISVGGMILSLLTIAINFFIATSVSTDDITIFNDAATINNSTFTVDDIREQNNATFNTSLTIAGLAAYLAFFSLGLGPLGWVLPPELASTTIRSKVVSLTTFANRMTATFMTSTMLSIANAIGWDSYFCFLASINVTIWLLAWGFLPETKGKKLEDTSEYYS